MSMNGRFFMVPFEKYEEFINSDLEPNQLDYVSILWVEQAWHMLAVLTDQDCHVEGEVPHDSSCTGSISVINFLEYTAALERLTRVDISTKLKKLLPYQLENIYWGRTMQENEQLVLDSFDSVKQWLIEFKKTGAAYDLYLSVV